MASKISRCSSTEVTSKAWSEKFLRLKEKLEREGLFDPAAKRPVPAFPKTVGVVTSLAAAALRDILTTLKRRNPSIDVIVYPVPVQGEGAAGGGR